MNNYLNEAKQNLNNIVDAKEKSEMKNGIQYDKIELLINQNRYYKCILLQKTIKENLKYIPLWGK